MYKEIEFVIDIYKYVLSLFYFEEINFVNYSFILSSFILVNIYNFNFYF